MAEKKFTLNLLRARLTISARPYRSSKEARKLAGSRSLTIPTYLLLLPTKEIAFSLKRAKRRKKRPQTAQLKLIGPQSYLPFLLILAGLSGVVYFSKQQANSNNQGIEPVSSFSVPAQDLKSESRANQGLPRSKPTHIRIKRVEIDAPIMSVAQNKDKTIEVPPLFENITGWYKLGPSPGEIGPAVIVGHVDTIEGPSVFYRLKDLKKGDIIEITRQDKKTIRFKVTGLEQFSRDKFPTQKVYGNIDYAGLRLITCGGTFDERTQQYTANTVVFAQIITPKK